MKNIRCWFRSYILKDEIFKRKIIEIQLSDFYGCLKDCVRKPLSSRLMMDPYLNNSCEVSNDKIAEEYAKKCMYDLRKSVMCQAEQFFEEFYYYNIEDMKLAIKECIEK